MQFLNNIRPTATGFNILIYIKKSKKSQKIGILAPYISLILQHLEAVKFKSCSTLRGQSIMLIRFTRSLVTKKKKILVHICTSGTQRVKGSTHSKNGFRDSGSL